MSDDDKKFQGIEHTNPSDPNIIKGGYQVTTPTPPPDPVGGNWGTAVPIPETQSNSNPALKK